MTDHEHVLLINVPSRRGGTDLPLGLLYVASIIERYGYTPHIVDPYVLDPGLTNTDKENYNYIYDFINKFDPKYIGFGGIASSYGRTVAMSRQLHEYYPNIIQFAGGPLASTYEYLHKEAPLDVIFHGETETSLPLFFDARKGLSDVTTVPGISFVAFDGIITKNKSPEQIKELDSIPFPSYDVVHMSPYIEDMREALKSYVHAYPDNPNYDEIMRRTTNPKSMLIITSRGCTSACSFCYRHMRGHRQHSVGYVMRHIRYLKDKYHIGGVHILDELFNADKEWVMKFCAEVKKENIFYKVGGARVDKMDAEMLDAMWDSGCIAISYGQESGSDIILRELRKGTTAERNEYITKMTLDKGIYSIVQIVVGSPGETIGTVMETSRFVNRIGLRDASVNYLIPLPGSPVWKVAKERIKDIRGYLDDVAETGGRSRLNLTAYPDFIWRLFGPYIRIRLRLRR